MEVSIYIKEIMLFHLNTKEYYIFYITEHPYWKTCLFNPWETKHIW